jgi:hypothetical protein
MTKKKKPETPKTLVLLRISDDLLRAAQRGGNKEREALIVEVLEVYERSIPRMVVCGASDCSNKIVRKGFSSRDCYCCPKCASQGRVRRKMMDSALMDAAVTAGDLTPADFPSVRAYQWEDDE